MGQRPGPVRFPAPHMGISWHEQPYGDPADCWGCGTPTDLAAPEFHGVPSMHPRWEPPRVPQCQWCTDLVEILEAEHERRWRERGYDPPPRKPRHPPRGPSGISPGRNGAR